MRSLRKLIIWLIGIILILYMIISIVLHYTINPNAYKSLIEKTCYKFTGHPVTIHGDLKWNIFPNPTIRLNDVLIKNPEGTQSISPYFAKIDEVDLQISLLPLLSAKIEPKEVTLRGADVNLIDPATANNPISKTTVHTTTEKNLRSPAQTSYLTTLTTHSLPKVTILNTNINWIDLKRNKITHFKNINLSIVPKTYAATVKGNLTILTNQKQMLEIKLNTHITATPDYSELTLDNVKFGGTITARDNTKQTINYSGPIIIHLINQNLSIPSYRLEWNGLPLSGTMSSNWKTGDKGLTVNFNALHYVAGGVVNEKGSFNKSQNGQNSIRYLVSVHHIDLVPVLNALHYGNLLQGAADITATLTSTQINNQSWIAELNGNGKFNLSNVKLSMAITHYLSQALALKNKSKTDSPTTSFSTIAGSFTIHNGVLSNTDLVMTAKNFSATGSGSINLNTNTINYELIVQNKKDTKVPIKITGNLQQPQVNVDLKNLSKMVIENVIQKKEKQIKNLFNDQHIDLKKIF